MKMGLTIDQPQVTPPCPGCASTTRLQQMPNKTDNFFGCSRFPLCNRVVFTSLITESRVSPSAHSCSAAQPMAEQVMALDSDSVGSERELHNVECSSRISCNTTGATIPTGTATAPFVLWHHGSGSTTGDRSNVSGQTAEDQCEQSSSDLARHDAEDLNNTGVLQSVRVWTEKKMPTPTLGRPQFDTSAKSVCHLVF